MASRKRHHALRLGGLIPAYGLERRRMQIDNLLILLRVLRDLRGEMLSLKKIFNH